MRLCPFVCKTLYDLRLICTNHSRSKSTSEHLKKISDDLCEDSGHLFSKYCQKSMGFKCFSNHKLSQIRIRLPDKTQLFRQQYDDASETTQQRLQ